MDEYEWLNLKIEALRTWQVSCEKTDEKRKVTRSGHMWLTVVEKFPPQWDEIDNWKGRVRNDKNQGSDETDDGNIVL